MKQTLLLVAAMALVSIINAQKKITAYAITGMQKGQSGWSEVRLVDITTGDEVQSIYQSAKTVDVLNARTGKPVVKKALADNTQVYTIKQIENVRQLQKFKELLDKTPAIHTDNAQDVQTQQDNVTQKRNVENLVITRINTQANTNVNTNINTSTNTNVNVNNNANKTVIVRATGRPIQTDRPFATNSAALAYDKKHERLYYTPMNIAQLRYIDLKTGKVYFFEDDQFGVVQGRGDVQNQVTRMVIASDGNGYAITNDANHLIKFTTDKKAIITDLGPLTDDASNGSYSVHNPARFGGDVIADANKNLYLVGADRTVYKINLDSRTAGYMGSIKGLPKGFTTNGAVVEEGSSVIVTSSTSTIGYFRFDLNTLLAEKVSTGNTVFNASDLANGTLAFEKTKKKKKDRNIDQLKDVAVSDAPIENEAPSKTEKSVRTQPQELAATMSVYPNPVMGGSVKLSFANQLPGKYQIQLLDIAGQIVSTKNITISNKTHLEEFKLPEQIAHGSYLVKVISDDNRLTGTSKLVVQ